MKDESLYLINSSAIQQHLTITTESMANHLVQPWDNSSLETTTVSIKTVLEKALKTALQHNNV